MVSFKVEEEHQISIDISLDVYYSVWATKDGIVVFLHASFHRRIAYENSLPTHHHRHLKSRFLNVKYQGLLTLRENS